MAGRKNIKNCKKEKNKEILIMDVKFKHIYGGPIRFGKLANAHVYLAIS